MISIKILVNKKMLEYETIFYMCRMKFLIPNVSGMLLFGESTWFLGHKTINLLNIFKVAYTASRTE